jgi:hypothetical protein
MRSDDPAVPAGWDLPAQSQYLALARCVPCSDALRATVRIPECLAERHSRAHSKPIPDAAAFAKSTADYSAVAFTGSDPYGSPYWFARVS